MPFSAIWTGSGRCWLQPACHEQDCCARQAAAAGRRAASDRPGPAWPASHRAQLPADGNRYPRTKQPRGALVGPLAHHLCAVGVIRSGRGRNRSSDGMALVARVEASIRIEAFPGSRHVAGRRFASWTDPLAHPVGQRCAAVRSLFRLPHHPHALGRRLSHRQEHCLA